MTDKEFDTTVQDIDTCLGMLRTILTVVNSVDDVPGKKDTPSPEQSQVAVRIIRQLVSNAAPCTATEPAAASGVFKAAIMQGDKLLWTGTRKYTTHSDAVAAITRKAALLKLHVAPCTRQWVTAESEGVTTYMVDFGDYTAFGRITKEN